MPESAQKVLHELTAAGLLSADQATDFGEEVETGVEALLTRLVTDGHITQYQADKFQNGQSSDIHFGDYVVLDHLGQGGMGTVLLAKHRRMDRQVAIKILPVTALDSEAAVARFYQEVKVAAQLTHPNIVHAYDAGEHHGFHYLVMEYVKGHDLAQVQMQLGAIPASLAIDYLTQAATGLEYAHRKGVVHRDLKPSNLLLDNEGNIKILDMGLARIGGQLDAEASAHLTTTGQMMGTVEYMSPEQAEDTRVADARSDIYSLGCTLYRMIAGKGPYSRDTVVKTILAHRNAAIPDITLGDSDDVELVKLFSKMVAKNPGDRYQTTTILLEALRKYSEGESLSGITSSPKITQPERHNTAVAFRVDKSSAPDLSIPEAIIPPDSLSRSNSNSANSAQGFSQASAAQSAPLETAPFETASDQVPDSEILYISDGGSSLFRKIRETIHWLKEYPDMRILILAVLAMITFGSLGLFVGPYAWYSARKHLRLIDQGKLDPRKRTVLRVGKWIAIAATFLSLLTVLGIVTAIVSA